MERLNRKKSELMKLSEKNYELNALYKKLQKYALMVFGSRQLQHLLSYTNDELRNIELDSIRSFSKST